MESLLQDLRYGFRMMLKAPGVTGVAIITMALGIGANTAGFTLIDVVSIRPLPFPEPERLVVVGIQQPGDNSQYPPLGDADFLAWRERHIPSRMSPPSLSAATRLRNTDCPNEFAECA